MIDLLSPPGDKSKYKILGAPPAWFLSGLWHGFMLPIFFLLSLFNDGISIYETKNTINGYNLGYLIGVGLTSNTIQISIGSTVLV